MSLWYQVHLQRTVMSIMFASLVVPNAPDEATIVGLTVSTCSNAKMFPAIVYKLKRILSTKFPSLRGKKRGAHWSSRTFSKLCTVGPYHYLPRILQEIKPDMQVHYLNLFLASKIIWFLAFFPCADAICSVKWHQFNLHKTTHLFE